MPVPGLQEVVVEQGLPAAGGRLEPVVPAHKRRQRHQDGLRAAVGLQAEDGAAVEHQVELHVPPPAIELEAPFRIAVGNTAACLHNGQVAGQEAVPTGLGQPKQLLPAVIHHTGLPAEAGSGAIGVLAAIEHTGGILVVEEDAADAAGLATVLEVEVFIAPALEHREVAPVNAVAGLLQGGVEVPSIRQEGVVGGEIGTTAEPPHRPGFEVAVVEVNGGDVGVTGVKHHGRTGRKPGVARGFGSLGQDRRRECFAFNFRKVHAPLLQQTALLQHPGAATTTLGAVPTLFQEAALTIHLFQGAADPILQIEGKRFEACS